MLSLGASWTAPSPRAGAAVVDVVADADGDADDALVIGLLEGEGAVVGDGFVGVDVVEVVLDEVGALHAGEDELAFSRSSSSLHGVEHGVVGGFGVGEGWYL